MKEEAQANAEADKAEKERIDKINHADSLIFQTEKQLKEFGDKIPADKLKPIEEALEKLRQAHKDQNIEAIDLATSELNTVFQAASQEMYNAQQSQANAGNQDFGNADNASTNQQTGGDDEVTDVDFEEVK